jgi:integrase
VALLIDTGFRLSEAIRMEWRQADVDPQTGDVEWVRILKDNKADYPRSVPTTARVKALLKARREARPEGERRVFHDLTVDAAQWAWECVRTNQKMTDDPEFVLHCCRHTFASRLAMSGATLPEIKELGGWKTLAMVMRYAHLCPDSKANAIKRMEARSALKVG